MQIPEWLALQDHYQKIRDVHLRALFAEDPGRGERLTAEAAGLYEHSAALAHDSSTYSLIRRYRKVRS